jgi:deazaflavin-dependent oxidoreductase (nitroreductase family)
MLANRILKASGKLVAERGATGPIVSRMFKAHVRTYRLTRGLIGHRVPGMPPFLLLQHVGAKSGTTRTTPLGYVRDGDKVVLIASKGGGSSNPAWFYNLRANPDVMIQIGARRMTVRAHVADANERDRLWPMFLAVDEIFAEYQQRTERELPLVVLEPRATNPAPHAP